MHRDQYRADAVPGPVTEPEVFFNRRVFLRATAAIGLLGPAVRAREPLRQGQKAR